MAAVISALDTQRMPTRTGENGHPEHSWISHSTQITDLREQFVQLFFQLVRPNKASRMSRIKELAYKYTDIIKGLHRLDEKGTTKSDVDHLNQMLTALPNQTRDCVKGKGERDLAYSLLIARYEFDSETDPVQARKTLVDNVLYWCKGHSYDKDAPPGSWKDIVGMCNLIKEWYPVMETQHFELVRDLLKALADRIHKDATSENPSLAAKWAPRESSKKQQWLFYRFVRAFTPDIGSPKKTPVNSSVFKSVCKTVRKVLSSLNHSIDTLEVKQCAKEWATIDPKTVPSVALQKQKKALLNIPRKNSKYVRRGDGEETDVRSTDEDRIKCAENFREYTEKAVSGEGKEQIKAQRTSLYDLVRDAMGYRDMTPEELLLLEEQWKDNGRLVKSGLPPMIPMVDVSGSMTIDNNTPLYYALGLGLRASEKTHPAFRNRILTFSHSPAWVRLEEPPTRSNPTHPGSFVNRIDTLRHSDWGMNTNFFKALQMILDTLVANSVPPTQASSLVLAVFSDMQIDEAAHKTAVPQAMHDSIRNMYAEKGYSPPHVLYWNLRTTNGFPSVTTEKNVTMLSGFSPVLLNVLENKGIEALSEFTPFRTVSELLTDQRFHINLLE